MEQIKTVIDFGAIKRMVLLAVIACIIVLVAMLVDLVSGLHKAKLVRAENIKTSVPSL